MGMIFVTALVPLVFVSFNVVLLLMSYKVASGGRALVRSGMGGEKVSLSGLLAYPVLHKVEEIECSLTRVVHTVSIKDSMGNELPLKMTLLVSPNMMNFEHLLEVYRFNENNSVQTYFKAKLEEIIQGIQGRKSSEQLHRDRLELKMELIMAMGESNHGYVVQELMLSY